VIQYNLAVAFAIRGELDKASEALKQVCENILFGICMVCVTVLKGKVAIIVLYIVFYNPVTFVLH
jgi:hypothetical protein